MLRRALAFVGGTSVVVAGVVLPAAAASAAEDVITVTSTADCGTGSFGEALAQANASTNADGVRIVFDAALAGTGEIAFADSACYVIDADVPVSVDFTNLDGISTTTDADFAGIYVASDDVVLENLANLQAGAAGIAIAGSNVTVSNVGFKDVDTIISEVGVSLLDGASNVTVKNSEFASQWWSSILVDSSAGDPATVSNITIDNITSRSAEAGWGHIDLEVGAVVNGLTVTNSTFGVLDEEAPSTYAVFVNPANTITDLTFSDNTVLRGVGEADVFRVYDGNSTELTNTVFDGNTFTGVSESKPLGRVITDNNATWNGLTYTDNTATFTRGLVIRGEVSDADISGNTFTSTQDPNFAAITLGNTVHSATVTENVLDRVWALDGIQVIGTEANDVVIENNQIHDFHADVSRAAISAYAPGSDNVIRGNQLIQHLDLAGDPLPATLANHWAVYLAAGASAGAATETVGWSVTDNAVDGFGGDPAINSEAPIRNDALGKTLIVGNTFGTSTNGSVDEETENGGFWFVWNAQGQANNHVQTLRPEQVTFDGSEASFTIGVESDETTFTTADCDVAPGAPDAPKVTKVTTESVDGTGEPQAKVTVYDEDGNVIGDAVVADDGTWTVPGLECGSDYTVVQTVDGVVSDETSFTTPACSTGPSDDGDDLATTGLDGASTVTLLALALLMLIGGSLIVVRRRKA